MLSILVANTQNCKVKLSAINKTYTGECKKGKANGQGVASGIDTYKGEFKKGFPHGIGIYIWSKENKTYEGSWSKGKMNGRGKMTFKDKDSVVVGYWKKDIYIGMYEKPYKIFDRTQEVTQISIKKIGDETKTIRCYIKVDDKRIQKPEIVIHPLSGSYRNMTVVGDHVELHEVTFPFKAKIYYKRDFIIAEIFQSGVWNVKIDLDRIKGLKNTGKSLLQKN